MTRTIKKEDIEFLKNLQHEMLTQETDCEAAPRYWVVAQHERSYGCDSDCSDGCSMYDSSAADFVGDTVEEVIAHVKDYYEHECKADEDEYEDLLTMESLADYLNKHVADNFRVIYYSIERSVRKNGSIFLTKRECKEHIVMNNYHYNDTVHTYADTSWRSPQFEKLIEILENVDFDSFLDKFIQFGVINEKETREMDSVVCPHCYHRTSFEDIASKFNSKELNKFNIVYDGGVNSSDGGVTCPECGKKHNVWINTMVYSFVEEE